MDNKNFKKRIAAAVAGVILATTGCNRAEVQNFPLINLEASKLNEQEKVEFLKLIDSLRTKMQERNIYSPHYNNISEEEQIEEILNSGAIYIPDFLKEKDGSINKEKAQVYVRMLVLQVGKEEDICTQRVVVDGKEVNVYSEDGKILGVYIDLNIPYIYKDRRLLEEHEIEAKEEMFKGSKEAGFNTYDDR